jgi:TPR repeat protein
VRNKEEAVKWLQKAAAQGNAKAQQTLKKISQ